MDDEKHKNMDVLLGQIIKTARCKRRGWLWEEVKEEGMRKGRSVARTGGSGSLVEGGAEKKEQG